MCVSVRSALESRRPGERGSWLTARGARLLCSDVHGVDGGLVLGHDLAPLELLHGGEHVILRRPQLLDQDDLG